MCDDMRSDLKRQKQRQLQFLLRLGKKYDTGRSNWTGAHRKWLESFQFKEVIHKEVFKEYYTVISEMEVKYSQI